MMEYKKNSVEDEYLHKAKEKIVDAIKAYRELCVCYRVGRQPSEKLFKRLKKADGLLKTLEES